MNDTGKNDLGGKRNVEINVSVSKLMIRVFWDKDSDVY